MQDVNVQKSSKKSLLGFKRGYFWILGFIISACGAKTTKDLEVENKIGFAEDYVPPNSNFDDKIQMTEDPNFKILEPMLLEPYWVKALSMSDAETVLDELLSNHNQTLYFSFPKEAPHYIPVTINGWAPAGDSIIEASREIFTNLEQVLNIEFREMPSADGLNNLAISQSIQVASSGFSYYPNNIFQLGSDIFIDKDFAQPTVLTGGLTNYDYEVLIHEIGHALGLKHPFEADRTNNMVLNEYEDYTKFTAMSYDSDFETFDGIFRSLDWMTLTKFYGVNPEYRSDNDTYTFDDMTGKFIMDGNGIDAIKCPSSVQDIFIDLRPGTHSYEGSKSDYITSPRQLTISHGSEIENVETGSGADIIIGNQLSNTIQSGDGDDKIFAGEGMDIVHPSGGQDIIDLSEDIGVADTLVIEKNNEDNYDIIYGFAQGMLGDVLDFSDFNLTGKTILPIVNIENVPFGYIDSCLVKIFGEALDNAQSVKASFSSFGSLENLKLSSGQEALLITAASQETGEAQNIYSIENKSGFVDVLHVTQLVGNYLDIDNWSADNFVV